MPRASRARGGDTVEGNNFATFEQYVFKKSSQSKDKPQSPITPGLSEGVGGDMARDTYEMTLPRHVYIMR